MLRINLLPPYIHDRRNRMVLLGVWGAVLALVVIGSVGYATTVLQPQINTAQSEKDTAQTRADSWADSDKKIKALDADMADTKKKMDFVSNSKTWNDAWPATYSMMRDYTDDSILLQSMSLGPDHRTITMNGFTQNERNLLRWWTQLANSPDLEHPTITLPQHDYSPNSQTASAMTGGFGGRGGGGFGGGAPGPGFSGGYGSIMSQMAGRSGGGGMSGFGSLGAQSNAAETEVEGRKGIQFVATAQLKKPFAGGQASAPAWGGAAGGAAAGNMGPYGGNMGPYGSAMMGRMGGAGGGPRMGGSMAPVGGGGPSSAGGGPGRKGGED